MNDWFTINTIDEDTCIISEYRHWEETHCYLLNGKFPLTIEQIKDMVIDRCDLPEGYDVDKYKFFQGNPARLLKDNDEIALGGRNIRVLFRRGRKKRP